MPMHLLHLGIEPENLKAQMENLKASVARTCLQDNPTKVDR
jgi:hypothetical protein